jgi:hypothetical protein
MPATKRPSVMKRPATKLPSVMKRPAMKRPATKRPAMKPASHSPVRALLRTSSPRPIDVDAILANEPAEDPAPIHAVDDGHLDSGSEHSDAAADDPAPIAVDDGHLDSGSEHSDAAADDQAPIAVDGGHLDSGSDSDASTLLLPGGWWLHSAVTEDGEL